MRILAITRGTPPVEDVVTVGSAIRAYNYLYYLRKSGAECFFLSGADEMRGVDSEVEGIHMVSFSTDREIPFIIESLQPDFIIVCVSELMQYIPENLKAFVILDLFAHRFTESLFENVDITVDIFLRLESLRKADYFIVNSVRQRDFICSVLILAGLTEILNRVIIIPHIIIHRPLERKIPEEPVFVAGGFSWPWADDRIYIDTLSELLEKKERGEIRIYGGKFALESRTNDAGYRYKGSKRLRYLSLLPYSKLLSGYSEASAGILCFEKNIERFFSYNFRASDYLFSGLPIIVNDYLQISELVKKYDAGWVVRGVSDFEEVIEKIISDNEIIMHKSDNVTALVMQEFDSAKCMEPLINIIAKPVKNSSREGLLNGLVRIVDRYVREGVEHSELLREVKSLEAEKIRLSERIVSKDSEILRLNNEKTEILRENGWLKDELKRFGDEISRLKDEVIRLKNEKDRLERELSELNSRYTEILRKNGFLEDEKIRLSNEVNQKSNEIINLKNEITELKKSLSLIEIEIRKRDDIISGLKKKEEELEGIKSLPMYRFYKKLF